MWVLIREFIDRDKRITIQHNNSIHNVFDEQELKTFLEKTKIGYIYIVRLSESNTVMKCFHEFTTPTGARSGTALITAQINILKVDLNEKD